MRHSDPAPLQQDRARMKLEGIRVLDLSRFLPGPMLTQAMADHGAEVIKVESIGEGEPTREIGETRDGISVFFANANRGKRSLALNLKHPEGIEALMRLAAVSDVMIESFRPGVAERLGISYRQVAARAPRIVYASISAFGQTGPYRDIATHDLAIEAMAGVLSLTKGADSAPAIPGLPAADMLSSMAGLSAVLMALLRRTTTGRGDCIDMAMAECLLAAIPNTLGPAMATRQQPDLRAGRSLGGNALYAIYATRDGDWIALAGQEMKFAVNLLTLLGRPDLIDLCRLPPGPGQDPLRAFLRDVFLTRTKAEWVAYLAGHDLPFAPVQTLPDVLDDRHFRDRGAVRTDARGWDQIGSPIRFQDEPGRERFDLPALGQDSASVLGMLGYSAAEIAGLEAAGTVRMATEADIARHACPASTAP
jgi:crotonobetainyl-CoA:carnitine CoA-transferase CaiB-like acyl-CoA transferase